MRIRHTIAAALTALVLSSPALADGGKDQDPLSRLEPQALLQGMIREGDVSLLFDYLRLALAAAAEGREAPAPEALQKRAEALGDEIKMRGALTALLLLNALEAGAKQLLREPAAPARPALPPTTPFTPIRD